ncbi:hypothetical protein DMP23_00190 [Amycolatopsis sp. A1MSW2902]|uniref:hypothetical protein n=1 Tax=Amycolatopsis sp. A1MSW2902 TaxID=687413 RepID=UPI00307F6361
MSVESEWAEVARASAQRRQDRRALVLSYADLRDQLCREPIGYRHHDQWNGYAPPGNTARAIALRGLVAEAEKRQNVHNTTEETNR